MESTAFTSPVAVERFSGKPSTTMEISAALDVARVVAATLVGGLAGASVADMTGVAMPIPVLVGLSTGVFASSRFRPDGWANLVSRVLLVVGLSAVAGAFFVRGDATVAWVCALLAFGLAGGGPTARESRGFSAVLVPVLSASFAAIGLATAHAVLLSEGIYWETGGVGVRAFAGGLAGLGLIVGQRLPAAAGVGGARVSRWRDARRRTSTPVQSVSAGASDIGPKVSATVDPIAVSIGSLKSSGDRVLLLLDQLAKEQPSGLVLVDEIRDGVRATLEAAYEGVHRWGIVNTEEDAARIARLEAQIATNEAEMAVAQDERLCEVISATLVRQRAALTEIRSVDGRRRAFAFRLQQAEAGLDVLRVSVERAVTEGDELKHAEVDLLIDTLNDAQAFFREQTD